MNLEYALSSPRVTSIKAGSRGRGDRVFRLQDRFRDWARARVQGRMKSILVGHILVSSEKVWCSKESETGTLKAHFSSLAYELCWQSCSILFVSIPCG